MKTLSGHLLSLLGCLISLYGVIWVVSMLLMPADFGQVSLDTSQAKHSLYMTEPKYIYLNRAALSHSGAKIVLVGASNTVMGFRQHELAPMVDDATVDNLAIGGANVTETSQVVDLASQVESPAALHHTTFVIGVWYGMFASNRDWWFSPDRHGGDTDIDIERYRYGFCWRTANGPLPLVPPRDIGIAALAIHPYLVAERAARILSDAVDTHLLGHKGMHSEQERNDAVVDEADKQKLLSYWTSRIGTPGSLPSEQFDVLHQLITRILAMGSNVVLVDLPLPHWHQSRSPYVPDYYRQLQPIVDAFQDAPRFHFLHLQGLSDDEDFSDEVHPKPYVSVEWARQLANALNKDALHDLSFEITALVTPNAERPS